MKQQLEIKNSEMNLVKIKISKFNVLAENKTGILIKLNSKASFWISKKLVNASVYTNFIYINVDKSFEYNANVKAFNEETGETTTKVGFIYGEQILKAFKVADEDEIFEDLKEEK